MVRFIRTDIIMNCTNCNAPLRDGQPFCGMCGTPAPAPEVATEETAVLNNEYEAPAAYESTVEPAPVVNQYTARYGNVHTEDGLPPVGETVVLTDFTPVAPVAPAAPVYGDNYGAYSAEAPTPYAETPDNFNINFSTEENAPEEENGKKKRKFKWGKFFLITIPALLVSAAIIFNLGWIIGFAIKIFGTPEAYLKFCEKKGMYDTIDTIGPIYENAVDNLTTEQTYSVDMNVSVSDTLLSLLAANVEGASADLSFLKNISVKGTSTQDGFKTQFLLDLMVNDALITDVNVVTDLNTGNSYIGLPELSDKYALEEGSSNLPIDEDNIAELVDIIKEIAPSKFELGMLLSKYTGAVYTCADNAEKESETLEIDGISQKVTKISYEITEESTLEAAKEVLEKLSKDKGIKKFIEKFQKEYEDRIDDMDTDLYDDFSDMLDDGLDALDEREADSEEVIYAADYINGKHEIVGREFEINGQSIFIGKVEEKDDFKVEIRYNDMVILTGSGTDNDKFINGEFDINIDGAKITLGVKNFDRKALKKGYLCGTLTVTPDKSLFENTEASMLGSLGVSLEISLNQNENENNVSISANAMGQSVVTVDITSKKTDFKEVSLPAENTLTDIDKFGSSINLLKLMENLKKAGIPEEFLAQFILGSTSEKNELPGT